MDGYPARRTHVVLLYNNKDITEDVSRDLISFSWTDKSSKEADDLTIKLHNVHGLWCGDWQAAKGAKLTAEIVHTNWNGEDGENRLPCGTFEIDETTVSGPPSEVAIKGISVPITSKARGQAKTRAWDNVRLSQIASDVAGNAGLDLIFELAKDPLYQREDQLEEADLSFLQGLATEAGASLKVSHDKLILFDEKEYEKKPSVLTLDVSDLTRWSLQNKSSSVYRSCKVKYHDPETDEDIEHEEDADLANLSGEDQNGRTLSLNQRCKNLAEAEELAKNTLHDANKYEVSGKLDAPGDLRVVAGVNIELTGVGRYSGKYVVDTVVHTVDSRGGHVMSLNIRRGGKGSKGKGDSVNYVSWSQFDHLGKDYSR